MNRIERLLTEKVYPELDRSKVLAELEPKEFENRYFTTCPSCGKRSARIYKTGVILYCDCGYFSDILSYIKTRYCLNDQQAFEKLIAMID